MNKPTLFIVCGEAFSGKTTLAKEISNRFGAEIVGRDRIYFALEKMLALEITDDEDDDKLWTKDLWPIAVQGAKNHLSLGKSVVFDDVCLHLWQRDELRSVAQSVGADSVLVYLDVPAQVLKERRERNRITKERHDVPSKWLTEDSYNFERPADSENPIKYAPETNIDDWFSKLISNE
ncbi:ATP-binding protein [Candidatus Parcubacteria bacterium]|nr:ATP-binding protein [Candidatus Parcubacteria bacterium]